MLGRFNLSEWALKHRSLVLYGMIVTALLGLLGYSHLANPRTRPTPSR